MSGRENGGSFFGRESIRRLEEERQRRQELRKQQATFASVAEEFIERHVKGQRKARDTEREIRKELIAAWGDRPITSIAREDVVTLVDAITKRPAPYFAYLILSHTRSLFNWAINRGAYELETSPCDRIKPGVLIGPKQPRQRVLNDAELAAVWIGSETMGYPFGPLYQLLMLTGARKNEVAGARWREFDLEKKLWTVPPERFKSNASHLVPLSDAAIAIIEALPRFTKGDHLFTTTYGEKPVAGFSKGKARLDN